MIHLKQAINKQFYFIVTARNGQVLVTSEMYMSKRGCKGGVKALVKKMAGNLTIKDHTK